MSCKSNYNPFALDGKTILITGASSGIGRATAIECSKMGAMCVITGRNESRLQETFNLLEGTGHQCVIADLSVQDDIDRLVGECPIVNGIVNNAGVGVTKPVTFYKQSDLDFVFQTNTFAPMLINKGFLKKKKVAGGGSIVFTSSVATLGTWLGNGIYGASKSALTTYMRYCARELGSKKIRVNAVHPGMVETKLIHGGALAEEDLKNDMTQYPLGRYGRPEEIAQAIVYLLSDASAWVTGSSLVIDGGYSLI